MNITGKNPEDLFIQSPEIFGGNGDGGSAALAPMLLMAAILTGLRKGHHTGFDLFPGNLKVRLVELSIAIK
jgi:hypothetical protein